MCVIANTCAGWACLGAVLTLLFSTPIVCFLKFIWRVDRINWPLPLQLLLQLRLKKLLMKFLLSPWSWWLMRCVSHLKLLLGSCHSYCRLQCRNYDRDQLRRAELFLCTQLHWCLRPSSIKHFLECMMRHPSGQIDALNEWVQLSRLSVKLCICNTFFHKFAGPSEFLQWSFQTCVSWTNFALNTPHLHLLQDLFIAPANCSSKVSAALCGPMMMLPAQAIQKSVWCP